MGNSIVDIEGIGASYASTLRKLGVHTCEGLLKRCADKKGRRQLAEETGISETLILKWTNMADLMRIRGVGEEYSELLEAAGVDTVKELKHRNAANLAAAMADVNARRRLVRLPPGEKRVASWIARAKALPALMTY